MANTLVIGSYSQPVIPSDVIAWEVYEYHSRQVGVVTSSVELEIGTVLAFDTGTNAWLPITAATAATAQAVLVEKLTPQVVGSPENFKGQMMRRTCNLKDKGLIYPATLTAAQYDSMIASLEGFGIIVKHTV